MRISPGSIPITLTPVELIGCYPIAGQRRRWAIENKQASYRQDPNDHWNTDYNDDLLGVCAEVAGGHGLDRRPYLSVEGRDDRGDLEGGVEIRGRAARGADLRLYNRDDKDRLWVLVVCPPPRMLVVGGGYGRDLVTRGRRDRQGWLIPQAEFPLTAVQIRDILAAQRTEDAG